MAVNIYCDNDWHIDKNDPIYLKVLFFWAYFNFFIVFIELGIYSSSGMRKSIYLSLEQVWFKKFNLNLTYEEDVLA